MRTMRSAIMEGESAYIEFIKNFLICQYCKHTIPSWVLNALKEAGVPDAVLQEASSLCGNSVKDNSSNNDANGSKDNTNDKETDGSKIVGHSKNATADVDDDSHLHDKKRTKSSA